jgi:2-oxoglutarate dehydrogenase E1 component
MTLSSRIDPESFLYGPNGPYINQLLQDYVRDPASVSEDWRSFFMGLGDNLGEFRGDGPPQWRANGLDRSLAEQPAISQVQVLDSIRALMLIRAYRVRGHLNARLDPLNLENRREHPELMPQSYGFTEEDYDRPIFLNNVLGLEYATLKEIIHKLRLTYCQSLGVEFMHIQDPDQKSWIQERVENTPVHLRVDDQDRRQILKDLIAAEHFEKFLQVKYPGAKRFGLEGGESLIPALQALLSRYAEEGVEKVIFGMAHRGRLNVLANILEKPFKKIFAHFQGVDLDPALTHGSGDVKYHLGYSTTREIKGHQLALTLMPNPSHLEAVNPVVLGKVRSEQALRRDEFRSRVLGVLLHGDAAFAGQGLVAETLELSELKGYRTGGTIHVIINNQIGFTTSPPFGRSSPYSSDMAKAIQAPIFHINGDDPETAVWVLRMAAEFQRQFAHDVVIDLICYRRYGHNEIDEPSFTQPKMYQAIENHPSVLKKYREALLKSGDVINQADVKRLVDDYEKKLREQFDEVSGGENLDELLKPQWMEGQWSDIMVPNNQDPDFDIAPTTGVDHGILEEVGAALVRQPEKFVLNKRLSRLLSAKEEVLKTQENLDWATCEALAFGSLLLEGYPVRLSGQDSGRGTFSQRHSVWVDQETEEKYVPLNRIRKNQALIEIVDSPLSEASVLGFEYGYTMATPNTLVLWEAQFGDFANGAQVIIDQFISAGEYKWNRLSGLVMLLPHGYEGQGPEHSSARPERFLQLCAEQNMRVVNCSTPANYFHVLRRQLHGKTRKPLIIMTPKSLLRHKLAVSCFAQIEGNTQFAPVIGDPDINPKKAKRVIICSGKIYYDLYEYRQDKEIKNVALIRLEQYYPFPERHLAEILSAYSHAEFVWCQEEPKNMGAWTFLDRRLESVLRLVNSSQPSFNYVGRKEAASPSSGSSIRHEVVQAEIIQRAFEVTEPTRKRLFAL